MKKADDRNTAFSPAFHDPVLRMDETAEQLLLKHRKQLGIRDHEANKGTYGRLTLVAGSRGMAGAAYLSGLASFRCGIGMVKYLGPECNRVILQQLLPEAMYDELDNLSAPSFAEKAAWGDYLVMGPGLSRDRNARQLVRALFDRALAEKLQEKKLIVLDADALNLMAEEGLDPGKLASGTPVVITPHVVEMSRLTGLKVSEIKKDPEAIAGEYAAKHGVFVVLKDARTVMVAPGRTPLLMDSGCGAMAKAGSGDVLCGFIAGMTAMLFGEAEDALPLAVYLHGVAGCIAAERLGCHSILARDIAEAAGEALTRSLAAVSPVRGYVL